MIKEDIGSIFILNQGGIGDFVMLIPTLRAIRANLPEVSLNVGAGTNVEQIARMLEGEVIDNIFPVNGSRSFWERSKRVIYLSWAAKKTSADVYAGVTGGYVGAAVAFLSPAKRKFQLIGNTDRRFAQLFYTDKVEHERDAHQVKRNLTLCDLLGVERYPINFDFGIPGQDVEAAEKIISRYELRGKKSIALVPQSSSVNKNWPAASFRETIDELCYNGFTVVLFGQNAGDGLRDPALIDLRGNTSFMIDSYLLRSSRIFDLTIGVDTGIMHVAGSVNSDENGSYADTNRTISLFGPTDPKRYMPYDPSGKFNSVVQPPGFHAEFNGKGKISGDRSGYMQKITSMQILHAVEHQLNLKKTA